ncbi:MAG: Crp/Fnr family transcriptional regulator [Terriglobales bacterium]
MTSPYGLPTHCLTCHLRPDNFLCALSGESLDALNQIKHAMVVPEGAVIFLRGQTPRGVFLLCRGRAKVCTTSEDGGIFILEIAEPGTVLGLDAVVVAKTYDVTVETMQPCLLNFVSREDFLPFLKNHVDACFHAVRHLSRKYHDACNTVRSVGLTHSIPERLAKFLLELSAEGQVADGVVRTKVALTHEELSQLIGTSRETITRTLSEFRKQEIAELRRSTLIVHNKPALERLAAA